MRTTQIIFKRDKFKIDSSRVTWLIPVLIAKSFEPAQGAVENDTFFVFYFHPIDQFWYVKQCL